MFVFINTGKGLVSNGQRCLKRAVTVMLALILLTVIPLGLQAAGVAAFPDVPLVAGAQPQYASLALDEKGGQVAFILFDGTAETGYRRAYLWVPGHARYGTPIASTSDGEGTFATIKVPIVGGSPAEATWQLRAWTQEQAAHEGGTQVVQRHDYVTGQTVTQTIERKAQEAKKIPKFDFRVRYRHAGSYAQSVEGATDLTDIAIDGSLPVGSTWNNRPPPFAPWNQLHLRGAVNLQRSGEDPDGGIMKLTMELVYQRPCQITSLLQDSRIEVDISRYLEDPLVSESLTAVQALSTGFTTPVPFGWYLFSLKWDGEGIGVRPFARDVFPFGRQ